MQNRHNPFQGCEFDFFSPQGWLKNANPGLEDEIPSGFIPRLVFDNPIRDTGLAAYGHRLSNRSCIVLRIVYLTPQYFPRHVGGTEVFTHGLAVRARRAGRSDERCSRLDSLLYDFVLLSLALSWEIHPSNQCGQSDRSFLRTAIVEMHIVVKEVSRLGHGVRQIIDRN